MARRVDSDTGASTMPPFGSYRQLNQRLRSIGLFGARIEVTFFGGVACFKR
jgi:hypothetical protein